MTIYCCQRREYILSFVPTFATIVILNSKFQFICDCIIKRILNVISWMSLMQSKIRSFDDGEAIEGIEDTLHRSSLFMNDY